MRQTQQGNPVRHCCSPRRKLFCSIIGGLTVTQMGEALQLTEKTRQKERGKKNISNEAKSMLPMRSSQQNTTKDLHILSKIEYSPFNIKVILSSAREFDSPVSQT